jgi:hypothetical protein
MRSASGLSPDSSWRRRSRLVGLFNAADRRGHGGLLNLPRRRSGDDGVDRLFQRTELRRFPRCLPPGLLKLGSEFLKLLTASLRW